MTRSKRKMEHVQLASNPNSITPTSDFDDIHLVHQSFPEVDLGDVALSTSVGSVHFRSPLYINAMTGGSDETAPINASLAQVAREVGMAMAVGSQSAALRDPRLTETYRIVRKHNPNGIVMANISASSPVEFAKRAIDMLEAQLLQIHVNAPQELVMPEGDHLFTGWLKNVEAIVRAVEVPVIVKEVGFGMSRETIRQIRQLGACAVDLGGRGGTDFVWIENERRADHAYSYLQGWGVSTAVSLLEASSVSEDMDLMASGGIRQPLDAVKCMVLGASAVGLAGQVLRWVRSDGIDEAIHQLRLWHDQLKALFTLLGARDLQSLRLAPAVILGDVHDWCEARGIDVSRFATRG